MNFWDRFQLVPVGGASGTPACCSTCSRSTITVTARHSGSGCTGVSPIPVTRGRSRGAGASPPMAKWYSTTAPARQPVTHRFGRHERQLSAGNCANAWCCITSLTGTPRLVCAHGLPRRRAGDVSIWRPAVRRMVVCVGSYATQRSRFRISAVRCMTDNARPEAAGASEVLPSRNSVTGNTRTSPCWGCPAWADHYLSALLRRHDWYHYSGDYRIGTRYLDESILDLIKEQAMVVPFLSELLRNDWIYIRNNIKVPDLGPVLVVRRQTRNPDRGRTARGLPASPGAVPETEIAAMYDAVSSTRRRRSTATRVSSTMSAVRCELDDPGRDRPAGKAHPDALHPGDRPGGGAQTDRARKAIREAALLPPGIPGSNSCRCTLRTAWFMPQKWIRMSSPAGCSAPVPFAGAALRDDCRDRVTP